jgi:hypothetical protein
MRLAVFIGLAFGIGVLAEDISNKYVDDSKNNFESPFSIIKYPLLSKEKDKVELSLIRDLKVESLVEDFAPPDIKSLAKELAENGAFEMVDAEKGAAVQEWILSDNPQPLCEKGKKSKDCVDNNGKISSDDIKKTIIELYYYAKNRTYKETNYYDEMKKIQSRWDFSRSIALISSFYTALALVGFPFSLLSIWIRNRWKHNNHEYPNRFWFNRIRKGIVTLIILFAINFFSYWAYQREADEFNKRAFGYFSSMLRTEKLAEKKAINKLQQNGGDSNVLPQVR